MQDERDFPYFFLSPTLSQQWRWILEARKQKVFIGMSGRLHGSGEAMIVIKGDSSLSLKSCLSLGYEEEGVGRKQFGFKNIELRVLEGI